MTRLRRLVTLVSAQPTALHGNTAWTRRRLALDSWILGRRLVSAAPGLDAAAWTRRCVELAVHESTSLGLGAA